MIRAAFYAPLKPPTHPVPSGDRAMGRALLSVLEAGGVKADLASALSTRDGVGDAEKQTQLRHAAKVEIARLIPEGHAKEWRFWITYHNYYKAPDLIGPAVATALGIPYVLVEATRARKRISGPWAEFAEAAETATDAASTVFYLTRHDEESLRAYSPPAQKLVHLKPFLARDDLPDATRGGTKLLSVGMFRGGDKLASYQLIADTLARLQTEDWQLEIAGDGPARDDIERLMDRFGSRVTFLGELSGNDLQDAYRRAGVLFWPGVNEAFGMTYLEAQATGLTVVAQDRPGVRDVLAGGVDYPHVAAGPDGLAARLDMLLSSPKMIHHLGQSARRYITHHHLLKTARDTLRPALKEVLA